MPPADGLSTSPDKNSCSVVGLDASGRGALRRRLHREGVVKLAASLPNCVMATALVAAIDSAQRLARTGFGSMAGVGAPANYDG